jgi:MFS family permease
MDAALLYLFKVSPIHFGFLETTLGIGSLFGAIGASMLIKRLLPHRLMLGSLVGIGIMCIIIIPLEYLHNLFGIPPLYVWMILLGFVVAFINVPLSSLFVILTPDHARGRGSAIFNSIANTAMVAGLLIGGYLASTIGIVYSLAAAGAILIIVTALFRMLKYYHALKSIGQDIRSQQQVAPSA